MNISSKFLFCVKNGLRLQGTLGTISISSRRSLCRPAPVTVCWAWHGTPQSRTELIDLNLWQSVKARVTYSPSKTHTSFPSRYFSSGQRGHNSPAAPDGMSAYVVGHDHINKFFYITLDGKKGTKGANLAKLDYDYVRPNLVDLYHTEVPPEFQGQGIAKLLATAAFDHFCEKGIRFKPTCTYLQKYLRENRVARYIDNMEDVST